MKTTYQIDPAHSSIQFSIRHMMISNVRGSFTSIAGTLDYDPENVSASSVKAEIDVASISTGDANRDGHLKAPDFFDVEKYPKITFVSKKFEKAGDDEFRVTGDFTLHGVTKEVTLAVNEVSAEGKDLYGNVRIGAAVKSKISRKEYGLTWSAPLETGGVVLGDDVKIELDLQFIKQTAAA